MKPKLVFFSNNDPRFYLYIINCISHYTHDEKFKRHKFPNKLFIADLYYELMTNQPPFHTKYLSSTLSNKWCFSYLSWYQSSRLFIFIALMYILTQTTPKIVDVNYLFFSLRYHVFLWVGHVFPWSSHVSARGSLVFPWGSHVFPWILFWIVSLHHIHHFLEKNTYILLLFI